MARFLAVVEAPDLSEERFRAAFGSMRKWRFDRRGWVVKAFCCEVDGKVYVDAEAPDRERFAQWLEQTGWAPKEIHEVGLVFEAGAVWPLRRDAVA